MNVIAHLDGVAALIPTSDFDVYTEQPPNGTEPRWLTVYLAADSWSGSLDNVRDHVSFTVYLVATGNVREEAGWVLDKARTAAIGSRPTVPGRTCGQLQPSTQQPANRQVDDPSIWVQTEQWRFVSVTQEA